MVKEVSGHSIFCSLMMKKAIAVTVIREITHIHLFLKNFEYPTKDISSFGTRVLRKTSTD